MASKKSYFIVTIIAASMFGSVIAFNEYKNKKISEYMENRPETMNLQEPLIIFSLNQEIM